MIETQQNNSQKQKDLFKQTFSQILQDSKIDSKEANKLLEKFDLEKKEIISVTEEQLQDLKNQFWEDFEVENFKEFIEKQANYYLNTIKPDKELLYDGLTDFADYKEWKQNGVEELDVSWSNLYIKHVWDDVIITWQDSGNLFVEKVSKIDFDNFVKNYDSRESKRVLEEIWFTWWMTLGWVLAFSIRAWIGLLLWVLWTWFWAFRWYQLYKSYNLSSNEALEVLKENKDNKEIVKSYLFLSQIWYITWYKNGNFETIDGEKIDKTEMFLREKSFDEKVILKYQLLRWLKEKLYSPKFLSEWKYELDMHGLWDNSPLSFENGKVKFSTSYFEEWKEFEFKNEKEAFEKIQLINECLELQYQTKNNQSYELNNFSSNQKKLEKKLVYIKQKILN